ncbi:MAG TPA: universal stress protein [Nitrospirota bacterium]|nr:universal stress protein [Nitrospirota bacterium]
MKISNILVATDGSKVARKAVRYAADLARQLDASVTLLEVVDLVNLVAAGANPVMMPARMMMETRDLLRQAASDRLDQTMADFKKKGLRVHKSVRTGLAADEIVKDAKKKGADLIVLGSHGRSALKAAVLGSVAYGVIHRDTSIPVLVVRK